MIRSLLHVPTAVDTQPCEAVVADASAALGAAVGGSRSYGAVVDNATIDDTLGDMSTSSSESILVS